MLHPQLASVRGFGVRRADLRASGVSGLIAVVCSVSRSGETEEFCFGHALDAFEYDDLVGHGVG
ncbi:MAG: hypothetical protein AAF729_02545, partial [Pseudomonadota bacterium]